MPLLVDDPEPDVVGLGAGVSLLPRSRGQAFDAIAADARMTDRLGGWLNIESQRSFDRKLSRMTGYSDMLTPEDANAQFGIDGVLSFDRPVLPSEAAWMQRQAMAREERDWVLSNSEIGPLGAFAGGTWGTMTDPVAVPLMFLPELLGVAKLGQTVLGGGRAAGAATKAGRLATVSRYALEGAAEGAIGGAAYEGLSYGLRNYEGDDYAFGDASRNVLLGAVLGGATKGVLGAILPDGAIGRAGPAPDPDLMRQAEDAALLPETPLPEAVARLPEDQRGAAVAVAMDRMADDAPVALGPLIERQRAVNLRALDEVAGEPPAVPHRALEADVAVTTRGTEIPVRYALVEIDDLVTSHDDDLVANGDYPAELQPRARERQGAVARNRALQSELNPRRLLRETGAESGAPIVAGDGVVESGNGRTIALRRAANEGDAAWDRYQQALAAAGFETEGMNRPVLVRLRESALSGEQRAALAREMNADVTERMGAAEQAMADAAALDDAALALLEPADPASAPNRPFARAFLARAGADQINALADADGRLSEAGALRLRAALAARAYGDARLVAAVFEADDPAIRHIGEALTSAAPAWAKMRADMARGLTPPELDLTDALRAAVDLVRFARDQKTPLGRMLAERLAQSEMFGGGLAPETEALLRAFYADAGLSRPRDAGQIAAFLNDYARQAQEKVPGPDLFGATPDGQARAILENLAVRIGGGGFEDAGAVLARLRAEAVRSSGDAGGDAGQLVRGDRGGGDGGGAESGGGVAARAEAPSTAAPSTAADGGGPPPPVGEDLVAAVLAEPEMRALVEETAAMLRREGVELAPARPADDAAVIGAAMRTAADCLLDAGDL